MNLFAIQLLLFSEWVSKYGKGLTRPRGELKLQKSFVNDRDTAQQTIAAAAVVPLTYAQHTSCHFVCDAASRHSVSSRSTDMMGEASMLHYNGLFKTTVATAQHNVLVHAGAYKPHNRYSHCGQMNTFSVQTQISTNKTQKRKTAYYTQTQQTIIVLPRTLAPMYAKG